MTINSAPPFTNLDTEYMRVGLWEPIKPSSDRRRAPNSQGFRQFRPWGRAAR